MITGGLLVLLGTPGAGKGTQAERLAEKFGLIHLSTGAALRKAAQNGTGAGKEVGDIMAEGKFVPDYLVAKIVAEYLDSPEQRNGFILDGFPRNQSQAALLEEMRADSPLLVLNIRVDQHGVLKRLWGRRQCRLCGRVYNIHFSPPLEEGVCDVCGGELIRRSDDRAPVVLDRLRVFRAETEPLIEYYSNRPDFVEVDGNQAPDHVFEETLGKVSDVAWLARASKAEVDQSIS